MSIARKQRAWLSAGILIVSVGGLAMLFFVTSLHEVVASPAELRQRVGAVGLGAPLVMIGLQILQVIAAPIPGQAIDLANGYLFGWWGMVVSIIGIGIGSTVAIWLARRFGRPLVEMLVTPKVMDQIQPYTRRRSYWPFFILFLIPGTPDDLFCFAIGLTSIPLRRSILIALLGRAPGVCAAVAFGVSGQNLSLLGFSLLAIAVSLAFALVLWWWPAARKMTKLDLPQ